MFAYQRKKLPEHWTAQGIATEIYVYCPGCKCCHGFPIAGPSYDRTRTRLDRIPAWDWNGNLEKPTFSPSLRCYYTHPQTKQEVTTCHLILTDGMIHFCADCQHELKGKVVPLPEIPADYGLPE